MFAFAICVLAVWRLTHLFFAEDGPWELFVGLRRLAGGGFFGKLLDCFYCLSIWIAIPFALYLSREPIRILVLILALSGGAILLERLGNPSLIDPDQVIAYEEDPP